MKKTLRVHSAHELDYEKIIEQADNDPFYKELFRQFRCSVNPNEQQNTDPECAVAADDEDGPDFEKIIEQVDNDPVYEEIFKHLW